VSWFGGLGVGAAQVAWLAGCVRNHVRSQDVSLLHKLHKRVAFGGSGNWDGVCFGGGGCGGGGDRREQGHVRVAVRESSEAVTSRSRATPLSRTSRTRATDPKRWHASTTLASVVENLPSSGIGDGGSSGPVGLRVAPWDANAQCAPSLAGSCSPAISAARTSSAR
jgi:hypothetical protein